MLVLGTVNLAHAQAPTTRAERADTGASLGWINVRDYGAKCDGVSNDQVAFQAAINALVRNVDGQATGGGGTIWIPACSRPYRIDSSIVIDGAQNGVRFLGAGQDVSIVDSRTAGKPTFDVRWARGNPSHLGIQFENFTVDSFGGARPSVAIRGDHWNYSCWVRGMRIRNHDKGLELKDSILFAVENSYFGDITQFGVDIISLGNASRYVGNTFVRNGQYAMNLKGNAVAVINNAFEFTGYDGKRRVVGSDRVLSLTTVDGAFYITGNYFEENGDGITAGRANIFVTGGGSGGVIESNFVDAIVLTPAMTAAIERNIWINNVSYVTIRGNLLRNATTWDVVADGTATGIDARSNRTTKPVNVPPNAGSDILTSVVPWAPPRIDARGKIVTTTVRVVGAVPGDTCVAAHDQLGPQDVLIACNVQAADSVRVVLMNMSGGAIDVSRGFLRVDVRRR